MFIFKGNKEKSQHIPLKLSIILFFFFSECSISVSCNISINKSVLCLETWQNKRRDTSFTFLFKNKFKKRAEIQCNHYKYLTGRFRRKSVFFFSNWPRECQPKIFSCKVISRNRKKKKQK